MLTLCEVQFYNEIDDNWVSDSYYHFLDDAEEAVERLTETYNYTTRINLIKVKVLDVSKYE